MAFDRARSFVKSVRSWVDPETRADLDRMLALVDSVERGLGVAGGGEPAVGPKVARAAVAPSGRTANRALIRAATEFLQEAGEADFDALHQGVAKRGVKVSKADMVAVVKDWMWKGRVFRKGRQEGTVGLRKQ